MRGDNLGMRLLIFLVLVGVFSSVSADGKLSSDIRISSDSLGYDLQYRVYEPEGIRKNS